MKLIVTGALMLASLSAIANVGNSSDSKKILAREIDLDELSGVDTWGGRKPHLAVVNPVLGEDSDSVISLCGEWDFTTREREGVSQAPRRNGIWGKLHLKEWKNSRKMMVPGVWEVQGEGEPGMSEGWACTWDNAVKQIRHKYMGDGWYRREVEIPSTWEGKRIWIKIGGVRAVGYIWVNGSQVAIVDNYCGCYKYEITDLVKPGTKAVVAMAIDNRLPSRKGVTSEVNVWGGAYRGIELEATPGTFIDDAWVRGDFDSATSEAHVDVVCGDAQTKGLQLRFSVDGKVVEAPVKAGENILRLPIRNFRPWSPEHPNLYTGTVELISEGRVVQSRRERFGVRKLEVRGKDIYLNGKPFFFRGFGDDSVYPITGYPPANVDVHRHHLALARRAGFNFVRLHTHAELPEYFEAADEMGILIQAELPYYSDVPAEHFSFDPKRDVVELWKNYRRHPSFAVYSMGNEGSFGPDLDRALHRYVKKMDPDRLKINQDCHEHFINPAESSDYLGGPITMWKRGSVDPERPFVNHEYLNLCVKMDARLEPQFTGAWLPPESIEKRDGWLKGFGLNHDWGERLQDAQHTLQSVWQKRGIECARTDPYCDGFCFWTIVDVVVWNAAIGVFGAQGLLDPFWNQKRGGFSVDDIAIFNRAEGIFCDFPEDSHAFEAGARIPIVLHYANYSEEPPYQAAKVKWSIVSDAGEKLASGLLAVGDLALGAVREIGTVEVPIPNVVVPTSAKLRLNVAGACNEYRIWLFPKRVEMEGLRIAVADEYMPRLKKRYSGLMSSALAANAEIVIAPYGSKLAEESLSRGQKVISLDGCAGDTNVALGWWWIRSQVGTAFVKHPVFGDFPHNGVLNELFFRILKSGKKLPYAGLEDSDMFAVGEGGDACYLYLAQANVGKGRLLMSFGLDVLSDTVEGADLLDNMIEYVKSDKFAPKSIISGMR